MIEEILNKMRDSDSDDAYQEVLSMIYSLDAKQIAELRDHIFKNLKDDE